MKRITYLLICVISIFGGGCTNLLESYNEAIENASTKAGDLKTKEVTLETAGTLAAKLGNDISTIQKLILSGPVDADDINTLRSSMPLLESLDMKGVDFVESEKVYITDWGKFSVVKCGIGSYMFSRLNLNQIVIPDNIEIIKDNAFIGTNLESINLPESITTFEWKAFGGTKLTSVVIPSKVKELPKYIFENCEKLQSIILPEGLTKIGDRALGGCSSLQSINLPQSLTDIESGALGRTGLKTITIPESVTIIPEGCFDYCEALQEVNLPSHLTTIGGSCFRHCISLTSIEMPKSVESLGSSAFHSCTSLKSIKLPDNIKTIDPYTFASCSSLLEVELPANLEYIQGEAFTRCSSLQYIEIPPSVRAITGRGAFDGNESLYAVFIKGKPEIGEMFTGPVNTLIYLSDPNTNVYASIKNLIIDGVASSLVLTDKMTFFCPQAFKAQKIIYKKTFNNSPQEYPVPGQAAGWVGISLPFTVTGIVHEDGRVLAPFNAEVADAKNFWLRKLTSNGFENATTIEADEPYIIAMPHNEKYAKEYNIEGTVVFSAENVKNGITIPATVSRKVEGPLYDFNSNYSILPKSSSIYVLNTHDYVSGYNYGSVFSRNIRITNPFEPYVTDKAISAKAPAAFTIGNCGVAKITRSIHSVASKPSIDDL